MRLTIGVMGSSGGDVSEANLAKAHRLGAAIAARDAVLITGGCPGLPYEAVRGAKATDGLVIVISPGLSLDEHREKYHSPVDGLDVLIYTGSGLMGREITNIRSCDMVVIAGGRTGTLGELAIAYDEGRLIGVPTRRSRRPLVSDLGLRGGRDHEAGHDQADHHDRAVRQPRAQGSPRTWRRRSSALWGRPPGRGSATVSVTAES